MTGEDTFDTLTDLETVGDIFAETEAPAQTEQAKQAETETQQTTETTQTQTQQREDLIPSWRLREEADARRRAEGQMAELQRRLAELEKANPKQEPQIWEDPKAFVDQGVKAAIDPVSQQLSQMREQFSQMMAVQRFGAEKVQAAFAAIRDGLAQRDPQVSQAYSQIMAGMDPYGDLVAWHQRANIVSTVGNDLDAYNQKIKDAALADPEFLAKALEAAQSQARGNPVIRPAQPARRASNVTAIPSVNRSNTASDDDDEPVHAGDAFRQAFSGR